MFKNSRSQQKFNSFSGGAFGKEKGNNTFAHVNFHQNKRPECFFLAINFEPETEASRSRALKTQIIA